MPKPSTLCKFTGLMLFTAQAAIAQPFMGVELGHERLLFEPSYVQHNTPPAPPEKSRYEDRASGTRASLLVGTETMMGKDFSVAVQGRISVSNSDWTANILEGPDGNKEISRFRYDIPFNIAVTVLPTYHVSPKVALFAETGAALGQIRERRISRAPTGYDETSWRPGLVAGLGMLYKLDEQWSVRLGYQATWYRKDEFDANRSDTLVGTETMTSRVRQTVTTLGLIRKF